uniref:SH3 domain-containing protein n=1 Tax=Caenorhabditis japonica TaxID=281687 RepID=A0A8R1DNL9_CAEJA
MEPGSGSPITARANFQFEGTNNDELSFDKDDIITITQQQDGGWWEGTHQGLTGWFPCAYVTLITDKDKLQRSKSVPNAQAAAREVVNIDLQPDCRSGVLESYVEKEADYIKSLLKTLKTLLLPIGTAKVLSAADYCTLVGNFEDIFTLQKTLLDNVEIEKNQDLPKMKIGGLFMSAALELRTALSSYAENHPNAVEVLKKKQFIALFTRSIMFFEVTREMTYDIKEKLPISGFVVKRKDATEVVFDRANTVEFTLNLVATGGEIERFLAALGKAENVNVLAAPPVSNILRRPSKNAADNMSQSQLQSPDTPLTAKPPQHPGNSDVLNMLGKRKSSKNFDDAMNSSGMKFDHELGMILPEGFELPTSSRNSRNTTDNLQFSQFPAYFLSGNSGKRSERGFRLRKDAARDEEIEFETLRILEGYCVETASGNYDFHGANDSYQQPHLIVAEDEKILVEEMVGDEVVLQEKSIVDAVYSIKDQLTFLQTEFQKLAKVVESEQKARRRLEHNLPKLSGIISPDGSASTPRKEINSFDS